MQRRCHRRAIWAIVALGLVAGAACSGDDAGTEPTALVAEPTTTLPPTTMAGTSAPPTTEATAPADPVASLPAASTAPAAGPLPAAPFVYPGAQWEAAAPDAVGLDAVALDELAASAEAAASSCTSVVRDGKLVADHAWGSMGPDQPREAWSVTKSVTSTLVGIAQDQGLLTVADRVSKYVPEWQGTASEEVTIRDILSNASGRHWDPDTDYSQMALRAEDKTAFAIGLGQDAAPGEVWAYNNSAIQVLEAVLEVATGESPVSYAKRVLFDPIGMTSSFLTTDPAGNALMYAGLRTTCRDLARFGYLVFRNGEWNGQQVVSGDYLWRATRESSTELNAAYGWLWWLNQRGPIGSAAAASRGPGDGSVADGQLVEGESADNFWAIGLFEQLVAVIPGEDIVAVRMGDKPPDDVPFGAAELTRGALAAVVEHRPT